METNTQTTDEGFSLSELKQEEIKQLTEYVDKLKQLQIAIDSNNPLSVTHGKRSLELALKCGEVLRVAKRIVKTELKQEWEKWLLRNIPCINLRTAQNYMRLATEVSIERESFDAKLQFNQIPDETCFVSFLDECESLREAYILIGVIKPKQRWDKEEKKKAQAQKDALEETKKSNKDDYNTKLSVAKIAMIEHVTKQLENANVVRNMNQWAIRNNKPYYTLERTGGVTGAILADLCKWVSKENFPDLTPEDSIEYKVSAVMTEMLKIIIKTHNPTPTEKTVEGAPEVSEVQLVE